MSIIDIFDGITKAVSHPFRNKDHENSAFKLAEWAHRLKTMSTLSKESNNETPQKTPEIVTNAPMRNGRLYNFNMLLKKEPDPDEKCHAMETKNLHTAGKALGEIKAPFLDKELINLSRDKESFISNANSHSDPFSKHRNHFIMGMKSLSSIRLPEKTILPDKSTIPEVDTTKLAQFMATNEVFGMFVESIINDAIKNNNLIHKTVLSQAIKSLINNAPEDEKKEICDVFDSSFLLTSAISEVSIHNIEAEAEQVVVPCNE